jgi:hypothetical protein
MIPPHVRAYLRALSDDASARVLGMAWDALDALGAVGCEASEEAMMEMAVVRDMVRQRVVFF